MQLKNAFRDVNTNNGMVHWIPHVARIQAYFGTTALSGEASILFSYSLF
jgi:hypothetical protein